jgi:hypothetical protein
MGLIAEVLEENTRGNLASLGSSKKQWERFDRSINHPSVFGDKARHGKSRVAPPPKPMSEEEAQSFIRAAAVAWLWHVAN